ncbi:hypothetical protein XA68_17529 [Ophiocordyceps unilateralis]|uniref:Dihydroneopterin aldolase/epimerase domain-containing protein n=1 Tax=Ophiocordyceps unilateralis TaxID=268505 RepID=A0A2A9P3C2_OPHUN|nr:hypothetical protein XA68_17529 [Ophiocordyceps unilateralis]
MSADVSLQGAFAATSSRDALAVDTVHYGQLSKAMLASVERLPAPPAGSLALSSVLAHVWRDIAGGGETSDGDTLARPLLDAEAVRYLELMAHLPKASLLGDGVSLALTGGVGSDSAGAAPVPACVLKLHALRVPTLIGINDNERLARQSVVISVEIDSYDASADIYQAVEAKISQETIDSSFGTLEALAAHLLRVVSLYLRAERLEPPDGSGSHITIIVEKPMAVPFAEAPAVELRLNTNEVLAGPA